MKKKPRFITILIGALLSGVALQATAANTINHDS
ncbi:type 1 fimbrial protein, partial [Klebsiella pneumoniae]|nr:type 1 fimbrial protein [Klebsiella pneumoniae]